jgi:hypothetical protein
VFFGDGFPLEHDLLEQFGRDTRSIATVACPATMAE